MVRECAANKLRCRIPTGESFRIANRWSMAERNSVARGLVLRSRRTGNQPSSRAAVRNTRQPVPGISCLGVPAQAGMGDWYENDLTRPRECPYTDVFALACTGLPFVTPVHSSSFRPPLSSFRRRPESRRGGDGKCSAGACPPLRQTGNHPLSRATLVKIRQPAPRLSILGAPAAGKCNRVRPVQCYDDVLPGNAIPYQ